MLNDHFAPLYPQPVRLKSPASQSHGVGSFRIAVTVNSIQPDEQIRLHLSKTSYTATVKAFAINKTDSEMFINGQ